MKSILNILSILIFLILPDIINSQTTELLSDGEYQCAVNLISFLGRDLEFPDHYGSPLKTVLCESTFSLTEKITCYESTVIEVFLSQDPNHLVTIEQSPFGCFSNLTKITLSNMRIKPDFFIGTDHFKVPNTSIHMINPLGFTSPTKSMVSSYNLASIVIDLYEQQPRNLYFESFNTTNLEVNCIVPAIASNIIWNNPTDISTVNKRINVCSSNLPTVQPGLLTNDFTISWYDYSYSTSFTKDAYASYSYIPNLTIIGPLGAPQISLLNIVLNSPTIPPKTQHLKIELALLQTDNNLIDIQTNYDSLKSFDLKTSGHFQAPGSIFQFSKVPSNLESFSLTGSIFYYIQSSLNVLKSVKNINLQNNKITDTLPPVNPMSTNVRQLDLSTNSISGTISSSYCTIQNLNVKSNLLVGSLPSCFICYGINDNEFQNRFSGNGFTNTLDWNNYQCDSILPTLRVSGNKIYLEGTNLGFNGSTIISTPPLNWNLEIASTNFSADYSPYVGSSIPFQINFTIPNRVFTLRSIPQSPVIQTISITKSSDVSSPYSIEFIGTDFIYDVSKIEISLKNKGSCTIISSTYFSVRCNIAVTSLGDDQETIIIVDNFVQRINGYFQAASGGAFSYQFIGCPGNCGLNGICNGDGTCKCDPGYIGHACNIPIIQCNVPNCNLGGTCNQTSGLCVCDSTHSGSECQYPIINCPVFNSQTCSGFGNCDTTSGICYCDNSHQGADCSKPIIQCPIGLKNQICSGQNCDSTIGECSCDSTSQGNACQLPFKQCPFGSNRNLCSGNGICNNQIGSCVCDDSHQGNDCSLPFMKCPSINDKECSGFGSCDNQTSICICTGNSIFLDCSGFSCASECNNGGTCSNSIGKCKCPANYKDDTCSTPVHYISSVDPCPSTGGQVIIYGWFSDIHTDLSVKIGALECNVTDKTAAKIICQLGAGTGSKDVNVTQNGSSFNGKNKFQYINVDNNKCPKDCSNQGKCDLANGQCTCNENWSGFDCSSPKPVPSKNNDVVIPISVPTVNIETGKASIVNQDTNYDILILSLLELDVSNNMVNEYDLKVKFNSTVDQINGIYSFNYQIPNTTCKISYTIKEIKQDTNYEFAGMTLSIEQGGLKISVTISNYSYESALNTLQLRFLSSAEASVPTTEELDNKCNELESTTDTSSIDPNQTLNYISISKNSKILSGRFINRVISDDRSTFMSSEVITSLSNSSTIVVGLNLPHCESSCILDPDFSVLVSPGYQSECSSNSSSSRKWLIPVAIVVPVVGVAALTLVSVVLYKKYRYDIRLFTMKKTNSLRKLRTFK